MEGITSFIYIIFDRFSAVISELTVETVNIIGQVLEGVNGLWLDQYDINLVLFSETPIISTSLAELLTIFFSIFYTVIFVICVWKIIKKVVVKITRWNKW